MRETRRSLLTLAALSPLLACSRQAHDPIADYQRRLRRLAILKAPPQPGDWLASHSEPGQTYAQFRATVKTPAIDQYSTLRIVPIGELTEGQQSVLQVVRDVLRQFFGLTLAEDPPVQLLDFPEHAQRVQYLPDPVPQLLTTYLRNDVLLKRRRPADAAVLGITAVDLWPGDGWNFVFGQASLQDRVGVWSMARNGDADFSRQDRLLCALRTAMTATHETGHMFGIRHCIAYECGMNGSNNSAERDRQSFEFCPECQAKLWWTLRIDPLKRTRELEAVTRQHGFLAASRYLRAQQAALEG